MPEDSSLNPTLRKLALDGIYLDAAIENVGIYPQSVKGGKKPYEKRSEKMEGHNECVMEIHEYNCLAADFVEKHMFREKIEEAILSGIISINIRENKVSLHVNCNDLFYWACADCEEIAPEELDDLFKCCKESENNGTALWACRKRKMRPQKPVYEYLTDKEKELFNACGPERNDD